MKVHILGIGGTFMAGAALLAREAGDIVTGCDGPLYPPMSNVLAEADIPVTEGYGAERLPLDRDVYVIGNALSRGNPAVERILAHGLDYLSGPRFVAERILRHRHVIAIAGTHGKTTTTSLIAWLLEATGHEPGFLIGGVPENFNIPARLGRGKYFVIEADEYDTAFFDKRAKFVHYRPRTLVLNNLEYDHADIYPDLAAIERQFHHLVRTVPGNGRIVVNGGDTALERVLGMGCWTPVERFGSGPEARLSGQVIAPSRFELWVGGTPFTTVNWGMRGGHNMENALAALSVVADLGVPLEDAVAALETFRGVRRRLTLRADTGGVRLYDDFAHHPTAIARTLQGLAEAGRRRLVVFEPRSNSMREGVHGKHLAEAFTGADRVFVYRRGDLAWDPGVEMAALGERLSVSADVHALMQQVLAEARSGDDVIIMSNGGFEGLPVRLETALAERSGTD